MSPKNEMMVPDLSQLPSTQLGTDDDFESLATATNFLPRLELKSKGKLIDLQVVKPGNYCVPKGNDEADDLGKTIDMIVLSKKPKAIDMSDHEAIITCFNRNDPIYLDIEERAPKQNSHCMFGVAFLVFERSTHRFYEFFCGTSSLQRCIAEIQAAMTLTKDDIKRRGLKDVEPHGPITLHMASKITKNKAGNTWFVPVITPSSNPIQLSQKEFARAIKEVTKFTTLDEDGPKKAPEDKGTGRAR